MRRGVWSGLLLATALVSFALAADNATLLTPPRIEPCHTATPPRLPEKWRGVFLMSPFTKGQLVLSEIVHDTTLPATRIKLHGVRTGTADLLIFGTSTFELSSSDDEGAVCRDLGDTGWRPLPRDLVPLQAQCVGSAPLGEVAVDWWKIAAKPHPAASWIWFSESDQSPFRFVFPSARDQLPPLSRFAMSHRVSFEALQETKLNAVAATCRTEKDLGEGAGRLEGVFTALSRSRERADVEIARLMPALDARCSASPLPRWPSRLAMIGMMTPLDSDEGPYPTEILYDWNMSALRTRVVAHPAKSFTTQDSLLLGGLGYTVTDRSDGSRVCKQVLPGALRPDWPRRGPCECAAVISGTTPLSPHGTTRILSCPLASPRVAWAWYAQSGRPTTFMVTSQPGDQGAGLFSVLDYRDWLPGHAVPRSVFDKPPQCPRVTALHKADPPASKRCNTCHLGSAASK